MIFIDDYDNLTEDLENKSKFIEKVGDLLEENHLMMNDWETEYNTQKIQIHEG